jgi:predicted helicase
MHEAFRTALIHDLTQEGFADTYAQTITYGLLTAAISRTDKSAGADGTFVLAEDIHNMVPITNPFLKEMLESFLKVGGRGTSKQPGLDFDELGVQEVVELLRSSDIDLPAVLEDFGNRNPGEDPVIRFYEDFLKAYNKELKIKRGVFYTPQPVVSYIVRSVHELLQAEFGLPDGLASTITWGEMSAAGKSISIPDGTSPDSHFVVILDPATGTATFLVEVIDVIFRTLTRKWKAARLTSSQQREEWDRYVPAHLLPRLFGYELMMAPYAIAHMKIGLKLHETGYSFASDERVRIYLTNALEPPRSSESQYSFGDWSPALAHEAKAVNEVKATQRFSVIVGNPPYSKMSGNLSENAVRLIEPFRYVNGEKIVDKGALALELNLQDDYVKFWGLVWKILGDTSAGIAGLITNSRYLSSASLRGLRWSLAQRFSHASFFDLGGQISERKAAGSSDENVFDIEQGVAIAVGVRLFGAATLKDVLFDRLLGSRQEKYSSLASTSLSPPRLQSTIPMQGPLFRFSAGVDTAEAEFNQWPDLNQIMPFNSGSIITSRDNLAIDSDSEALLAKIRRFSKSGLDDAAFRKEIGFSVKPKWKVEATKALIRADRHPEKSVKRILYRPFDRRYIFYSTSLLDTPSKPVCESIFGRNNLVMLTPKVNTSSVFSHIFVSRDPAEKKACSHDRATQMFPLFQFGSGLLHADKPKSNISEAFLSKLNGAKSSTTTPENAFAFIYGILHSPEYRTRYGNALRDSFPRVPGISNDILFRALITLGEQLMSLHLLESPSLDEPSAQYVGPAAPVLTKAFYEPGIVFIDSARTSYFEGVSEATWLFEVGGYQVCDKWLKDRKSTVLSSEDIAHYLKIVTAISETIRIMAEIDEIIEVHGGWPGAFA